MATSTPPPQPGAVPLPQGREDRPRRVQPRHEVGDRRADLERGAVGIAGYVHHPALALHDQIVAGPVRVGSGPAEARDGAEDRSAIVLRQALVAKAKAFHRAWPEVLDDDVGAEIGEQHPREWSGDHPAQVEDLDSGKRDGVRP
jgi:hypothetical protein